MNANLKTKDFYGRDFYVDKNVLTPRPETEQIIDEVKSLCGLPILPGVRPMPAMLDPNNLIILDIGTGSGCIAITLKLELPKSTIYASDISAPALKIARKNAQHQNASVNFIVSHLIDKVKDRTIPTPDIIVANLPYVDPDWDWLDRPTLEAEDPPLALYASDHGLALIKELIRTASALGIKYLILEADPCEHQEIVEYAKTQKYTLLNTMGYIMSFISEKNPPLDA